MGRPAVSDPDPHQPSACDRRAHLDHRHITATELRHHVNPVELANGLVNRFLLLCCRRVRLLPEGGDPDPLKGTGLDRQLARHAYRARTHQNRLPTAAASPPQRIPAARQATTGIAGAISARAEAHTIRFALLYALLDGASRSSRSTSPPRSRSGTSRNAQPPGRSSAAPATRSPGRSTPRPLTSPRRADPHPTPRSAAPKPFHPATRLRTRHSRPRRQDHQPARAHRRPPRRALDSHQQLTAIRSGCPQRNLNSRQRSAAGLVKGGPQGRAKRAAKRRP